MATYKVLQDIEAEDKFLGPLTLKQFIFAAITIICLYMSFFALTKSIWIVPVMLLPFIIVFGFLAIPWGRDQPTEVWLLAKLRFYFKPRKRIWDQTGQQELVKITAPKKVEEYLSDGLSNVEVRSRLRALADTIDSRGWVIKNVDVNMFAQPGYAAVVGGSDRLLDASTLPQQAPITDVTSSDDIFSNQLASRLDAQIAQSKQEHQAAAVEHMQNVIKGKDEPIPANNQQAPPPNYWFIDQPDPSQQPAGYTTFQAQAVANSTDDTPHLPANLRKDAPLDTSDQALLDKVHKEKSRQKDTFRNHKKIEPYDPSKPLATPVTAAPPADILNLAIDSDRKVDSLAREARRNHPEANAPNDDEVVIPLH